jgi:hypothetical protein
MAKAQTKDVTEAAASSDWTMDFLTILSPIVWDNLVSKWVIRVKALGLS